MQSPGEPFRGLDEGGDPRGSSSLLQAVQPRPRAPTASVGSNSGCPQDGVGLLSLQQGVLFLLHP